MSSPGSPSIQEIMQKKKSDPNYYPNLRRVASPQQLGGNFLDQMGKPDLTGKVLPYHNFEPIRIKQREQASTSLKQTKLDIEVMKEEQDTLDRELHDLQRIKHQRQSNELVLNKYHNPNTSINYMNKNIEFQLNKANGNASAGTANVAASDLFVKNLSGKVSSIHNQLNVVDPRYRVPYDQFKADYHKDPITYE